MQSELESGSIKIVMHGKKLHGEFALVKIKNSEEGNPWLLIKHKDEFATDHYDAEENTSPDSKVSEYLQSKKKSKSGSETHKLKGFKNYTPALAGEKKLKNFITPMLCGITEKPFSSPDWAFEIKWDGYRAIADLRDEIQIYSRNGLSYTEKFRKISNSL